MIKAAGIIYYHDRSILLLRRTGGDFAGAWGLPGGKIEGDETPAQAARRESREEIGIEPPDRIMVKIDFTSNESVEFTTFKAWAGRKFYPVLNGEHDQYMWADLDSLPAPIHPGLAATLASYASIANAFDEAPSARVHDMNGYITIDANPISRAGIFQYLGRSISKDAVPDKVYNVYRPAEELESPEALASFKLLPIIDDHVMLGPAEQNFLPAEQKGVHGSTGENLSFKDGVLYSSIKIFSQTLKDMIQSGKRDLSLGYRCIYEKASGTFNGEAYQYIQRKLRGNHLALVDNARCAVAVLDQQMAFDHFDLALDTEELSKMADKENDTSEKEGDTKAKDATGETSEGGMDLDAIHAMMKDVMPKIAKINELLKKHGGVAGEEESEATTATTDEASVKPSVTAGKGGKLATDADEDTDMANDKDDDKDEKKAMDSAIRTLSSKVDSLQKDGFKTLMREASARDALASQLSPFVGSFDHAEMTQADVAAYGVKQLGIKCAAGQELAVLTGYLHGRTPSTVGFSMDSALNTGKKGKYAAGKNKAA